MKNKKRLANRPAHKRRRRGFSQLHIEALEPRALLAADLVDIVDLPSPVSAVIVHEPGTNPLANPPSQLAEFQIQNRWSSTATNGGGLTQGDPTTVTWSIADDGSDIPGFNGEAASASSLIAFMDGLHGAGPGGSDLTLRPWFHYFSESFARMSAVSGLTYVYEANDDGAAFSSSSGAAPGVLGVRGDIRLGGHFIDGQSGSNTLAYNFFPNNGEMVIDTGNTSFYGGTSNNAIGLRNVVMHENGHGVGLNHVESSNAAFLMEPSINTSFDGPQLDDLLALQRNYGDVWEKNGGNNTSGTALNLGSISFGQTVSRGTLGNSTVVAASATDFFSIDDESDFDYFKFTVPANSGVTLTLTPRGTTYQQGPQGGTQTAFISNSQSDLTLQLRGTDGNTILQSANSTGLGGSEVISNFTLSAAGTYFVRVSGATADKVQLYGLDVSVSSSVPSQPPVLSQPANQALNNDQTLPLTLSVSDPDTPAGSLTYTASFEDQGYLLKQQYGFGPESTGTYNWGGQQEKWFSQTSGSTITWYFITPNGNFYRWGGGTPAQLITNSTLLSQVHPVYYTTTTRLSSPVSIATSAPVNNSSPPAVLTIDPPNTFVGTLRYQVSVSDGTASNAKSFLVTVNQPTTAPEIQLLDDLTDIADGTGIVNFNTTSVGATVTKTLTVKNLGTANLTLTQITQINMPNGYTLVAGFGSLTLAPSGSLNDSTTFQIRFEAPSVGTFSGPVAFANNDSDENPFDFSLSGTVTSTTTTQPPVLSQPANQALNNDQTLPLTLSVSDPDTPAGSLTYTASFEDQGYLLKQQYGFGPESTGTYNWGGQQEKWFSQTSGSTITWYFITPNGNFYRWGGGTPAQLITNSTLLSQVHPVYYTTTTRLSSPVSIATSAPVNNSSPPAVLTIDPPNTFVGTLRYQVSVSDGTASNAKSFLVTVNQPTTAPEIQLLDDLTDIADGTGIVNFNTTSVGATVTKTLTVKNLGTANLTLTQITQINMPNGYTLVAGFGSLTLAPSGSLNDSTTFQIRFEAPSVGTFSGPVAFANNDNDENPFDFSLSGTVTSTTTTQPPVLSQPANQALNNDQTLPLTLSVSDPDTPAGSLTYTASFEDQGYLLKQQYGFGPESTGTYNWGGQQEKWFSQTSGSTITWYFITPNGNFYRWGGGTPAQLITNSTLLSQVHPVYYTTTTRLSSPVSIATSAPVNNSSPPAVLTIDPPNTFVGTLRYQVSVSDGTASNAKSFLVTVNQPTTAPEIQLLDDLTDIADGTGIVNFNTTSVGATVTKTLTVKNLGTANLTLTQITQINMPNGYTLVAGFGSLTLAPSGSLNDSTTFQIRFEAPSVGTFSGPVAFANNDNDENPFNFTLNAVASSNSQPPVLSQPANQSVNNTQTLPVTLTVSDPDTPAADLTYTAGFEDLGYVLKQQNGFGAEVTTSYNWGGQQEKWFKQTSGSTVTWYFITPNGNFYRWGGGTPAQMLSTSTLLAQLHTVYYSNTTRLSSATSIAASAEVNNSSPPAVLTVDPPDTFVGTLRYQVTVSDGTASDSKTFFVMVN